MASFNRMVKLKFWLGSWFNGHRNPKWGVKLPCEGWLFHVLWVQHPLAHFESKMHQDTPILSPPQEKERVITWPLELRGKMSYKKNQADLLFGEEGGWCFHVGWAFTPRVYQTREEHLFPIGKIWPCWGMRSPVENILCSRSQFQALTFPLWNLFHKINI